MLEPQFSFMMLFSIFHTHNEGIFHRNDYSLGKYNKTFYGNIGMQRLCYDSKEVHKMQGMFQKFVSVKPYGALV